MRILLLCLAACASLASCLPSERELRRAALAGDLSFAASITPAAARKVAAKSPESPLFLALKILSHSERSDEASEAASLLLTAAAGLARDSSGSLRVDAALQRKIPFLHRAAALFRLCSLARQEAAALSADYAGGPLAPGMEALRGDIFFLQKVADGKAGGFLLPASASGNEFPLSSLSRFAAARRALSEALALTEPVSGSRSIAENETAVLRRLVLQRHYNAAAAVFFRSAARLGYGGKGYSLPSVEEALDALSADGSGEGEEAAMGARDMNLLLDRDFLSAAGRALLYSEAEPADSAAALEHLLALPALSESAQAPASGDRAMEARYVLKFYAARLLSKMPGQSGAALSMMESSLDDAPTDEDRDFSLWYMLDIARAGGNGALLDLIEARLAEWRSPEEFSDILARLITDLAAAHDLDSLLRLEAALPDDAPAGTRERACFAVALLSPAGSDGERERLALLAEGASGLYYRIRSAELLGKDWGLRRRKGAPSSGTDAAKETAFPRELAGQALALVKAAVDWDLPGQAVSFARDFPFARLADVQAEAQKLMKPGRYPDAMRLLAAAFSETGSEAERIEGASRETLEMLYPQLWHSEVAAAASATCGEGDAAPGALPESLIFGVIRQESFFDPVAVSHAGAKGLMQLMDLTAAEVAGKLKVEEYSLFEPETSIRFGSFYLSEMRRRLGGETLQAVCAYNAGIGRVRGWLRDYPPALDGKGAAARECIFVESVPFNETREYAKRVFTSAAVYSALYY